MPRLYNLLLILSLGLKLLIWKLCLTAFPSFFHLLPCFFNRVHWDPTGRRQQAGTYMNQNHPTSNTQLDFQNISANFCFWFYQGINNCCSRRCIDKERTRSVIMPPFLLKKLSFTIFIFLSQRRQNDKLHKLSTTINL